MSRFIDNFADTSDDDDDDLDITQHVARQLAAGTQDSLADFMNDEPENEEEGDSLDITQHVAKNLRKEKHAPSASFFENDLDDDETTSEEDSTKPAHIKRPAKKLPSPTTSATLSATQSQSPVPGPVRTRVENGKEKIVMTDDESDDVYEKFQASKQKKRKKGLSQSIKVKKTKENNKGKGLDKNIYSTRQQVVKKDLKAERRTVADDSIPLLIQTRRNHLLQSGELRTPPNYDGISFPEDKNLSEVEEKPVLPGACPCRKYENISLESSGGIVPASIAQWLRDYQVEGVRFMHKNFTYQKGCILGDDMGLGKTIQVIAFLTAAFGKTGDVRDNKRMRLKRRAGNDWYPRVLIVCPGTLMSNWQRELETWGWWHIHVYHGSKSAKESALQTARGGLLEIMITTYSTYRIDAEKINGVEWDCVIADECQAIKESSASITQKMNEINALCRIGLTGTAIMNNYGELWNLLNWIRPGELGTENEWNDLISTPLTKGQSHDATNIELATARATAKKLVHQVLPDKFLRRMKSLIAHQLPKKTDKVVFCYLTELQQEVYEAYLETDTVTMVKYSDEPCDCASGLTRGNCCYTMDSKGQNKNEVMFPIIVNLLSLSNHFANWFPQDQDDLTKREKDLEKIQVTLPARWEYYYRRETLINALDPEMCGKWSVLKKLLAFWHENQDKVLIFSYSKKLLKLLTHLMSTTQYNMAYLDGDMPLEERTLAVDNFNSDPTLFAFLISTRAGGVGLNIVSANKVVIFDPSWNPSHDLQAQDRAYRIGQKRDVEVFRLITVGTIEEIVYARQIYKQQQANIGYQASFERRYFKGVMKGGKEKRGELFGLKNLLTLQQDNVVLQDIINKTNIAETRVGVAVMDMDSQYDEEAAERFEKRQQQDTLSQLEAIVTGKDNKKNEGQNTKLDPIQAILASAGVEYTHNNTDLLGTSEIEEIVSRRAQEMKGDLTMQDQRAYGLDVLEANRYTFGGAPDDVKRRQFRSMRKAAGAASDVVFALLVESWSQQERNKFLTKFYKMRRAVLATRGEVDGDYDEQLQHQSIVIDDD